jgi:hypothetical protein
MSSCLREPRATIRWQTKNALRSIAICEALGIEASQTATTVAGLYVRLPLFSASWEHPSCSKRLSSDFLVTKGGHLGREEDFGSVDGRAICHHFDVVSRSAPHQFHRIICGLDEVGRSCGRFYHNRDPFFVRV